MILPVSSLVSVTPGVLAAGGTTNLLNGLVFSTNMALSSGLSTFTTAAEVAATCGAESIEASMASIYFAGYTNAQDLPQTLYFYQLPASPADTDYTTALTNAAAASADWCAFAFAQEPDATAKTAIAAWMPTNPNRYWGIMQDSDASILQAGSACFGSTVTAQATPGLTCLCNTDGNGTLAAALCLGWAASMNPQRNAGRTTLMFRNNGGVTPADITATQAQALLENGYSFYGSYKSGDSTFSFLNNGAVSGPFAWADSYLNQIWMTSSFQSDLLTLFSSVGQIPYATQGDTLLATAVQNTIDTAVAFGAIQPNVSLSAAQAQVVNAQAGRSIADTLATRGWYLLPGASTASAATRAKRGPVQARFFYMDGQSVQSISLATVEVQ
ncbi:MULTISPECIES: DUF3383 family protein [Acetobacter]|uniref:DUF3383 domain-containing protein n=1 Tax=Acetobacter pomorum DM001 TaxID=945681 RepID=F1YVM8_9PROT|nr:MULTISPECIES: DUF3383 family protein [Acetobacter]ATI11817.1 DUF3383 domain-containing protein [Acetobacter pomorum]AXC25807.1 DUF3383 family protein [Acetobacter sp. JWB]EGE47333.1 Hypothetical protein APO_2018 [Acetobacter pomorum DM001]KAA8427177.1 DUF3383 domain-containing protein [Acetobacter pomorum]KAA8432409.1 DUF3383 domain-containing protein [Acetobacter pomorum]